MPPNARFEIIIIVAILDICFGDHHSNASRRHNSRVKAGRIPGVCEEVAIYGIIIVAGLFIIKCQTVIEIVLVVCRKNLICFQKAPSGGFQ
jgi:hypothetical protein